MRSGSNQDSLESECWEIVESFEETIALDVSMDNTRKLKETVGKMKALPEGNFGRTFPGKVANIEATNSLETQWRATSVGVGPKTVPIPKDECWKMVETCIPLEESVGKLRALGDSVVKMRNIRKRRARRGKKACWKKGAALININVLKQ